jgi:cytochrome b
MPGATRTARTNPGSQITVSQITVWDRFVRVFHWCTVALFAAVFLSTDQQSIHQPLAWVLLALVLARILWGFVGSRHARFTDFVHHPRTIRAYLRDLRLGRARRYLGHNPAGGAMVVALLFMLLLVGFSGWLSETDRFFGVPWVDHLHHVSAHLLLLLVGVHVAGVVISSFLHHENLVLAMITGMKSGKLEAERRPASGPGVGARGPAM